MNEQYLEWMFLREHLSFWVNDDSLRTGIWFDVHSLGEKYTYSFQGNQYDIEKMKERYIELSKLLLKDYEL